jgi:hypothetical protein
MAYQNFDDHDRSGRTFQMDNARNLLQSCAPNSILFTGGDNDTFPLWYLQEVEGIRTDVRVMVLSYMNTDWYINQLRRTYYNSPAFNFSLSEKDYLQYGPNDVVYIQEQIKAGIDAKKYLELLNQQHSALRMYSSTGEPFSILPSRSLIIPIHQDARYVTTSGTKSTTEMVLSVNGNYLQKNSLAILDLLISNDWKRPVYFNFTSYNQLDLNVRPYLKQEGLVYRLTSLENRSKDVEPDTDLMYKNLITNANYENILRDDVYFNYEDYHARMIEPLRSAFNLLAAGLFYEGKDEQASNVLDRALHILHAGHLKPSFANLQSADLLLSLGRREEALALAKALFDSTFIEVKEDLNNNGSAGPLALLLLRRSVDFLVTAGQTDYVAKMEELDVFE